MNIEPISSPPHSPQWPGEGKGWIITSDLGHSLNWLIITHALSGLSLPCSVFVSSVRCFEGTDPSRCQELKQQTIEGETLLGTDEGWQIHQIHQIHQINFV